MLETTDTLLKGLAEGNENRWARFYHDYAPWIEKTLTNRGISHADAEEAIQDTLVELVKIMPTYKYDKKRKGAFHSLLFKIAQNKAIDRMRKAKADADKIAKFAAEPIMPSAEDWRLETFNIALRRVFADTSIGETSKIAFRRHVQQGESAEAVAAELGITVNNLYQIKNRIKQRIADEVKAIRENAPDGD
ncbi:MAG: sigma-70 family RNA polymerase sigma factor [Lentisphaerae bacterium]|nr:sigma-70 family RNA polymerase sigma factor [Lentisphaerota bacterium]